MTMQDPISDMLTRLRNAQMAQHETVSMPDSKVKRSILAVLQKEGFIRGYNSSADALPVLTVELKYFDGKPVIEEISRASRPGLRKYHGKEDIPQVRGGMGVAVISTDKGVMTDREAAAAGIGGEILCTVF